MSLHQCEGPELDELLGQVRNEFGPRAKVVAADKVRRGGVGGFFAKEWFELSVEVPDGRGAPSLDDAVRDTQDVLDLAGGRSLADDLLGDGFADQVASLPSTERQEFADVLASLAGVAASQRPAPSRPPEPERAAQHSAPPRPQAPMTRPPAPMSRPSAPATRAPEVDPMTETAPLIDQPLSPAAARTKALAKLGLPPRLLATLTDLTPDSWSVAIGRALPEVPALPKLPGSILAVVGAEEHVLALAAELAHFVGRAERMYVVARGEEWPGIEPAYHLPDAEAVRERSRRLARSQEPTVVAVVLDSEPGSTQWLIDVMGALTPDQTWLSVRAGSRQTDVSALMRMIGGADVLTLFDVAATDAPATMLGLDLPVAMLDGTPATSALWAGLLTDLWEGRLPDRLAAGVVGAVRGIAVAEAEAIAEPEPAPQPEVVLPLEDLDLPGSGRRAAQLRWRATS